MRKYLMIVAVPLLLWLVPFVLGATALWPGSLYTWTAPTKYCADIGVGGTKWSLCSIDSECGVGAPAGSCIATIQPDEIEQVFEEVEALEAWLPTSKTKNAATHVVTADGAGSSGNYASWNADGSLGDSGVASQPTNVRCLVVPNLSASNDHVQHIQVPSGGAAITLVAAWAYCNNKTAPATGSCTTPGQFSFFVRNGNVVSLTGGGNLSASTGTTDPTEVLFDVTDNDRVLAPGGGLFFITENTPSSNVDTSICVRW